MSRASFLALAALSLATTPPALAEQAAPATWTWDLPFYVPPPRVPADNPMSEEKFQLGRHLFYDKRLSGNGTLSCGSCHLQARAFTDGRMTGVGSTGDTQIHEPPEHIDRSTSVTVPNIGGYLGVSARYRNSKLSLGYRADTFFNAMDGGQQTGESENHGFYGPYLNVSLGLGG